jgi:UDP-N-acetylmuramyl pentapeptide phosphotransferase/UDP-N-acetylglucosamine-1-phosphate transferase
VNVLVALVVGFVVVRLVVVAGRDFLSAVPLQRQNHRGRMVATGGGIVLAVGIVAIEGGRVLLATFDVGNETITEARALVLVAVLGFVLLGFVDDVAVGQGAQGFRGHVRALARGELTTGGLKLAVGGLLSLVLASSVAGGDLGRLLLDGLLVALAANLGNLFDRAPGRAVKVSLLVYVPLAIEAGTGVVGVALAPLMGSVLGIFPDDLRERVMLGDAGANALGGALGLAAVLLLGEGARNVTVVVLALLNLASERWSFTRIIAAVPPLRFLDELGRTRT